VTGKLGVKLKTSSFSFQKSGLSRLYAQALPYAHRKNVRCFIGNKFNRPTNTCKKIGSLKSTGIEKLKQWT
jgi:hypothetical protein